MLTDLNDADGVLVPALLSEMLERLNVDRERAQKHRGLAGASRRCLRCPKVLLCGNWLETRLRRRPLRRSARTPDSCGA